MVFVGPDGRLTQSGALVLDQMWRQIAAGFVAVPCKAVQTDPNLLMLTPTLHKEGAASYTNFEIFVAVAAATSTDVVRAAVGSLATLNVFIDGGASPAGSGDIIVDLLYLFVYNAALDGGNGGFVIK